MTPVDVFEPNSAYLDASPIHGRIDASVPVVLVVADTPEKKQLWDHLVSAYHPLGNRKGIRIKQIAFIKERPVAALGWSNPALHLESRDAFIGWDFEQKNRSLRYIANNARFLILPWVHLRNLASHLLSRALLALPALWFRETELPLYLVETFVDESTHSGTCYHASNWIHLGYTKGFARVRQTGFQHHGNTKKVFVRVIDRRFRTHLECRQRYLPPSGGLTQDQIERLSHLMNRIQFHKNLDNSFRLSKIPELPLKLKEFAEGFRDCFTRVSQLSVMTTYWIGLMSQLRRKNAEAIALETGEYAPRTMQDFLCSYKWDHQQMLEQHRAQVAKRLNASDGAIAFDPSDNPKKGKESVGVIRQYCGNLGKVENCQSGLYASYISEKGYELIDSRLYVPKPWFDPEYAVRRRKADLPSRLAYQSKIEIALAMLTQIKGEALFTYRWVLGDTLFGASPKFRAAVPKDCHYFLDAQECLKVVPLEPAWQEPNRGRLRLEPKPQALKALATDPKVTWQLRQLGEGTKGPIVAKVAQVRVRIENSGEEMWLFVRHDPDGRVKFALSNAPEDTPLEVFCGLSLRRWKIEQCFRECKDMLGMADYENRTWDGWHRHMALVMTLHFFVQCWCLDLDPEGRGFTRHMSREIIAAAFTESPAKIQQAIKKVIYHLWRNYQAMISHWRTTLLAATAWAEHLGLPLQCSKSPPLPAL